MGNMCEGRQKSKFSEDDPDKRVRPTLSINLDKVNDSPISPQKGRSNFTADDTSPGGMPKNFLDMNNFIPKENVKLIDLSQ